MDFLQLLFPLRCVFCGKVIDIDVFHKHDMLCESCFREAVFITDFCERCGNPVDNCECNEVRHPFTRNRSVFVYNDKFHYAVQKMKYDGKKHIATELGRLIAKYADIKNYAKGVNIIASVPIHNKRRFERGFNQSDLIAMEVAKACNIAFDDNLLLRIKNTKPQYELTYDERKQNLEGAFLFNNGKNVKDLTIILVDDIFTTGSTLDACSKTLLFAGAKQVFTLTAAKTIKYN